MDARINMDDHAHKEWAKDRYLDEHLIPLGWPMTLPDNLEEGCEILRVVLDTTSGQETMHVTIPNGGYHSMAEDWGAALADVARAIAEQHANYLRADREDNNLLAAIRDGFNEAFNRP
jgi:hypothetical protein